MFFMVSVLRSREQSKDSMLRRFTKLVMEEGIIDEVRNRAHFKSPSEIKKEKNKELSKRKRKFRD